MQLKYGIADNFFKMKLKTAIFISSIILIVLFLFGTSYFSYLSATGIILDKVEEIDTGNLQQINNKLTSVMEEMKTLTRNLSKDASLLECLEQYTGSTTDYYDKKQIDLKINRILVNFKMFYSGIDSIEIYIDGSSFITRFNDWTDYETIKESGVYNKIKLSRDNLAIFEPYYADDLKGEFSGVTIGSLIYDDRKEVGIVFVVMKQDFLDKIFQYSENIIIGDSKGNKVIWPVKGDVYDVFTESARFLEADRSSFVEKVKNKDYRINFTKTQYNNWIIITYNRVSDLTQPLYKVANCALIIAAASILFGFILSRYIAGRITKPIITLMEASRKYRLEDKFEFLGNKSRSKGFKENVMLYFIIIVTLPLLSYNIAFYIITSNVIENQVGKSVILTFRQTINNFDSFIDRNERVSAFVMFDKFIQNFLKTKIDGTQTGFENTPGIINKENISKTVDRIMSMGKSEFELNLHGLKGELLYSTVYNPVNLLDQNLFDRAAKSSGEAIWTYDDKAKSLVLTRKIIYTGTEGYNMKTIGYISISYFEENIERLYKDINLGGSNIYFILDSGMIISNRIKASIGSFYDFKPGKKIYTDSVARKTVNGKPSMIVFSPSAYLPVMLTGEIPYKDIKQDNEKILIVIAGIQALSIFIIVILSYFFSFAFTKSINFLSNNLLKLAQGDMETDFTLDSFRINEIDELGETLNNMALRIKKLINEVYLSELKEKDAENEKKSSELVALQAQINPHFLYNTLESIKWMIKRNEKDIASEMITSLGNLFRLGISNDKQFITVEEEIKYAKTYVEIQKKRFGKKIEFNWIIDERVLSSMTPKLILQPLIENSIHHGLQNKENGGSLTIYCYEDDSTIVFKVVDNGIGIDKEKLDSINLALSEKLSSDSIGLLNVQKRIKLYFGENYSIKVESEHGRGTMVLVHIPKDASIEM